MDVSVGVAVAGGSVVLFSWLIAGLVLYLAIRRYHAGVGCLSSVLWFFWTMLWVGIVSAVAGRLAGIVGAFLVYLAFAAWHINAITQQHRTDQLMTGRYGSLTWHRVTYLGGHPGYRAASVKGVLLVTRAGLVLLDKYRLSAQVLCFIPVDQISQAESHGKTDRVVAWFSDMPLPMTFTKDQGTLAVQFVNDVGGLSVVSFEVGGARLARTLKTQVDYAIYDWRRMHAGGECAQPSPSSSGRQ